MVQPISEKSTAFYPSFRIVRLETLDDKGNSLSHASGFLIKERDGLSLYTCWHVLVGFDPENQPIKYPPIRSKLRVFAIASAPLIADDNQTLVGEKIGGQSFVDVSLYKGDGKPLWIQQKDDGAQTNVDLAIPHFDCVRLDATKYESNFRFSFEADDALSGLLTVGDDCFIVGFPFGYSPIKDTPHPTFLKRSVASIVATSGNASLLDGPGASCMSGCPILFKHSGIWKIAGLYMGVAFPESLRFSSERLDTEGSKLPLGKFMPIGLVRAVLGAIY